jgi:HPt (histidine-containing phosphotransfer) domain-containing protein
MFCTHGSAPALLDDAVVADLENLGGDMLPDLVELYFTAIPRQMSELSEAAGRGEALTVEEMAHRLSGGSSALGAARVSRLASELEATAKAGDLTVADHLLQRLRRALDETLMAYGTRLNERPR